MKKLVGVILASGIAMTSLTGAAAPAAANDGIPRVVILTDENMAEIRGEYHLREFFEEIANFLTSEGYEASMRGAAAWCFMSTACRTFVIRFGFEVMDTLGDWIEEGYPDIRYEHEEVTEELFNAAYAEVTALAVAEAEAATTCTLGRRYGGC